MDYGHQQQLQENSQFGSNPRVQNVGWNGSGTQYGRKSFMKRDVGCNEDGSQYGRISLMKQDDGPGLITYGDDRRQLSRDAVYDSFPIKDRTQGSSSDRGQTFREDRRPGNDNTYREIINYKRKDFSDKYDPEDAFTNGVEFSNSDKRNPTTSSYDNLVSAWQSKPYYKIRTDRVDKHPDPQNSKSPWNESTTRYYNDRNAQNSNNRWNESPQQSFKTERYPQNSSNRRNETSQQPFKADPSPRKSIKPWNESSSQSFTTNPVRKTISRWNESPQLAFKADRNLRLLINPWKESPFQPFPTNSDIPPMKRYENDEREGFKLALSRDRDTQSVYTGKNWRNDAIMFIAKEIIDARLNFKMNNETFKAALAEIKSTLKIQVEEVIKYAYPREKFAVVPVDDIIKLYRRNFTIKDDDELFNIIFVCGEKANTLGLERKIATGSNVGVKRKKTNATKLSGKKSNKPGKRQSFTPSKPNAPGIRPSFTPYKPNAPGIRPSFTPYKPNAPGIRPSFTPRPTVSKAPVQNPSFKQTTPKKANIGLNQTSPSQNNEANPDRLPQYINGDKKQSVQQKQMAKKEFICDEVYKCSPDLEKALDIELKDITDLYVLGCETSNEEEKQVAQLICDKSLPEFNKTIRLHLTKRLLDIKTNIVVRIFAHGKPPSRSDVEQALKPFGITTLKKSNSAKLMYVATLDSYENYDKLCATDGIPLNVKGEVTTLEAKPFQLTMPYKFRRQLNKLKKNQENEQDDDGIYDDGTGGIDDDDIQVIETRNENINEAIVIDDGNDEVVAVSDEVVAVRGEVIAVSGDVVAVSGEVAENKPKKVDEETQDDNGTDLSKDAAVEEDNVNDVDIDDVDINEDDLEDY